MLRRKTREDLWERLLAEKDRQITILADEIDYLRAQLHMAPRNRPEPKNPSGLHPVTMGEAPYMSEDEEDVRDMLESGRITADQLPEVLEALGYANTEIH
jgi:hypothetical protein